MDEILAELKLVPGVIGAFVFHMRNGIVAKALPPVFKENKLIQMAKSLLKMYAAARMNISGIFDIAVFYEESIVRFRLVNSRHCMIILIDPSANSNLLDVSLNLSIQELKSAVTIMESSAALSIPEETKEVDIEKLLREGAISQSLRDIELSLARVMGPIAKVIFRDALRIWVQRNAPSFAKIPILIDIVKTEIGDPEKFHQFREKVVEYIAIDN